jgi:hypothetical protein
VPKIFGASNDCRRRRAGMNGGPPPKCGASAEPHLPVLEDCI